MQMLLENIQIWLQMLGRTWGRIQNILEYNIFSNEIIHMHAMTWVW